MSAGVVALVLLAAVMHAAWNAGLKAGGDRLWTLTVMQATEVAAGAVLLPFLPFPTAESWPWLLAGVVIHMVYRLLLIEAYRHGDLGEVYPISRGTGPLLTATVGAIALGEWLSPTASVGVGLVCAGIIALRGRSTTGLTPRALITALGVGTLIASYTLTDAIGARISGHAISFAVWQFFLGGMTTVATYVAIRGPVIVRAPADTRRAMAGGLVAMWGYGSVVWATTLGPIGPVAALRETSVVFAVAIGGMFLRERVTALRLGAAALVALGAVLLVMGSR
jgi:drug/metabolite transporter (DMT)-like permease